MANSNWDTDSDPDAPFPAKVEPQNMGVGLRRLLAPTANQLSDTYKLLLKGVKAFSSDIDNRRVLKVHFDHDVTDEDRQALADAINCQRRVHGLINKL